MDKKLEMDRDKDDWGPAPAASVEDDVTLFAVAFGLALVCCRRVD